MARIRCYTVLTRVTKHVSPRSSPRRPPTSPQVTGAPKPRSGRSGPAPHPLVPLVRLFPLLGGQRGPFLPRHRASPDRRHPGSPAHTRAPSAAAARQHRDVRPLHRGARRAARASDRAHRRGAQGRRLRPRLRRLGDLRDRVQPGGGRTLRPLGAPQPLDTRRRSAGAARDVPAGHGPHDPAHHRRVVPGPSRPQRLPGGPHLGRPRPGAPGRARQGLGRRRARAAVRVHGRRTARSRLLGPVPHRLSGLRRARRGRRGDLHRGHPRGVAAAQGAAAPRPTARRVHRRAARPRLPLGVHRPGAARARLLRRGRISSTSSRTTPGCPRVWHPSTRWRS